MNSSAAIVCREVFDENSQPSAEEISEYAHQIGIDPESETHLLPLAKDGLMQALPAPWKAYFDEKLQTHYYFNEDTKKTQWEHPLDRVYREIVRRTRDSSTQDDTCASVQELLTSEENTKNVEKVKVESGDEELSTDSSGDVRDSATFGTGPRRLQPISGRPPVAPLTRPNDKKLSDLRISPLRRSIDSTLPNKPKITRGMPESNRFERPKLFKQQSEIIDLKMHVLNNPDEENFSSLMSVKPEKGFALTGKGSIFLKTKKSDLPSPDTEKSLPLDSFTKSDPPKGILREKLTDLQRRTDSVVLGKPRQTASFEDDRKSVRFNLENSGLETTVSPGSNSSSEQNEGQSVITSPPVVPSPLIIPSSVVPLSPIPSSPIVLSSPLISSPPVVPSPPKMYPHTLAPLVTRPPLPPRPQSSIENVLSPRESSQRNSVSGSERDSNESDSKENRGISPRRRVLHPPAADYIKPDLFQKNFQKISDLVRPGDIETTSMHTLHLEEPGQRETRPRSPMIPQKNKISINLMESIDSETSLDSPDKEFANLDLNDLDDTKDLGNEDKDNNVANNGVSNGKPNDIANSGDSLKSEPKSDSNTAQNKPVRLTDSKNLTQFNISKLEWLKTHDKISDSDDSDIKFNTGINDDLIESKVNSKSDSLDLPSKEFPSQNRVAVSPQLKMSNVSVFSNELKSPRTDMNQPDKTGWSSAFRPISTLNKSVISPQLKSSDSNTSLSKVTSPRLDGVILSQSKNAIKGSDNVVVVYQFETNNSIEENTNSYSKMKTINHDSGRDMIERAKGDEKRRLELALQKELEEIRVEWAAKERRMRGELMEELREGEEKFVLERRRIIEEQAERHRREIEETIQESQRIHETALKAIAFEHKERLQRETDATERQFNETMMKLREEHTKLLGDEKARLQSESDRVLSETREQLNANLSKERAKIIDENRLNVESLREEHTARIADLRLDYRAEVERLRAQHACHLEELRGRLATERAGSRRGDTHAIADKYRCLKEKYARLKHDVKMSIERRNKRRELSMTTGSETEKSNSHKATQSLERCKELNETANAAETDTTKFRNNNPVIKYNDIETSLSESNAQKSLTDNNNDEWRNKKEQIVSPETSLASGQRPRKVAVAFREPPRRRRERDRDAAVTTDCQDSSDATTAEDKPKEPLSGHGRRRCFTRLKSASTSRLNYSPKRGEGWSSPLESLRQQLRKLDDLEDQFPDLACQPAYTMRYPFVELGADTPELEFVRHRAVVEREGMRRARAVLRTRRDALRGAGAGAGAGGEQRAPSEEREATELEVALHRARALLGEKEIRLRHIERALRRLSHAQPPAVSQEGTGSEASSGSEVEAAGSEGGAVLSSLRALHADVRDIWLALGVRRNYNVTPESSSCNAVSVSQPRLTLSAESPRPPDMDPSVAERARGLRAWLQAP